MTITNTAVVDTTSKYIVQSKGIGDETDQILADGEKLKDGTNKSKLCLILSNHDIHRITGEFKNNTIEVGNTHDHGYLH